MNNQFFKCGCSIIDIDSGPWHVKLRFGKCKKHKKEFKALSYNKWLKIRKWKLRD